jgi:rod shape determining protein RodA
VILIFNMIKNFWRALNRGFDFIMLAAVLLLLILGVAVLYSMTLGGGIGQMKEVWNQIIFASVGLVLLLLFTFLDYRVFKDLAWIFYVFSLILLVLVLFFGQTIFGAQRWIDFGFFQFQPSELMKLSLIFVLARYFSQTRLELFPIKSLVVSAIIVAVPFLLVASQPDIGTATVFVFIWLAMLIISNLRVKFFVICGGMAMLIAPLVWIFLKDYQRQRILTFLEPEKDVLGAGYNVVQSKIAVGSGGLWGRGLGQGPQSQLNYLPVQHTDFIFAVLAEGLGFVGAVVLLFLFGVVIWRGFRTSRLAKDEFGMYVACGITAFLFFQIVINIGMDIGVMPVMGIPLPFLSYGGSSLLVSLWAVGILESIILRHRKIAFK